MVEGNCTPAEVGEAASDATKTLRQRIEENIFWIVFGAAVVVGGTVAGIGAYFYDKQDDIHEKTTALVKTGHETAIASLNYEHKKEIDEIKSRISSIERRLGSTEYIDINELMSRTTVEGSNVKVDFFADGEYYATTDSRVWETKLVHEADIHAELAGVQKEELFSARVLDSMRRNTSRVWRRKIVLQIEGSSLFKNLFQYIMVQKIPNDVLHDVFDIDFERRTPVRDDIGISNLDPEFLKSVDLIIDSDAVGAFMTKKLSGIMNIALHDPKMNYTLRNIQKIGPLLYVQIIYTLHNVKVDGQQFDKFFVVNEWFILSRRHDLLQIETVTPTPRPDLRNSEFDDVNLWLGSFSVGKN